MFSHKETYKTGNLEGIVQSQQSATSFCSMCRPVSDNPLSHVGVYIFLRLSRKNECSLIFKAAMSSDSSMLDLVDGIFTVGSHNFILWLR